MNDVLFTEISGDGDIGLITLNRPQALNALNTAMCIAITEKLKVWAHAPNIKAVVIRGEGERAFCAGGDIRHFYEMGRAGLSESQNFFRQEYRMNHAIFHFPKPYIALLHGITMGGGVGLSIHGSHRVAAENLTLAMPETSIGFYPDIGASYFLPRCQGKTGYYLGLVGDKIGAADAKYVGLVDHLVSMAQFDALITKLAATSFSVSAKKTVTNIIDAFALANQAEKLAEIRALIDLCFEQTTIQNILIALKQSKHPWAQQTVATLSTRSPTSLLVTLQNLLLGANQTLDQCLKMEFRISTRFLESHDFYEGIRAAIIDKDRSPQWHPKTISEVKEAEIAAFFSALSNGELEFN